VIKTASAELKALAIHRMNTRPHSGERVKDIAAGLLVSISRPNSRVKKEAG